MVAFHSQFEPHVAQGCRNSKVENGYHEHLPFTIQPSRTICRFHSFAPLAFVRSPTDIRNSERVSQRDGTESGCLALFEV